MPYSPLLLNSSALLGLIFAFASISLSSCSTAAEEHFTVEQRLDTLFQHYIDTSGFSGTMLVADSSGILFSQAIGYQNFDQQVPMQLRTAFYLASLSKNIHAAAIMYLADQGKLSIDDTLSQYLPNLPFSNQITIRQLLTHTHGVTDYYKFMETFPGMVNEDVLQAIGTVDSLDFKPGTQFSYSNSGYALLVAIVETVTEERYSDFMQRTFFDSIGMSHTIIFDEQADSIPDRAVAINAKGEADNYQFRTVGGGGIFSTIEDLYQWDRALYSGKYIQSETLQQAYTPVTFLDGSPHPYGFGWFVSEDQPGFVYHTGSLNGFRNYMGRWLDEKKLVILLSNNQHEAPEVLIQAIYEILSTPA
uniref:Serine hydrolase n=1 Tax=Roseihalotalea indica TaxID=2867963 RepID=A0AA49PZ33_9BACT|nr:serine hydrolase [Tunicatimonas sp. TK19036]